jgi:L-ascorbate metabolism protein UlaG (beta-lactamase superfamily)
LKVTWLGQAGLLFETDSAKILIDPYLSDSCGEKNPKSHRRMPIDESFLKIRPDAIVLTHDHLDHTDEQTLAHYLSDHSAVLVLAAPNAWDHVRKFGGNNNYVRFSAFTEWTLPTGIRISAVKAEHSDPTAIGVIVDDGSKKYYITGDTLYNTEILSALPRDVDTVFLPINGKGNNMNAADAARFADAVGAIHAVPLHFGLFDDLDPHVFSHKGRVIPSIYQPIALD